MSPDEIRNLNKALKDLVDEIKKDIYWEKQDDESSMEPRKLIIDKKTRSYDVDKTQKTNFW